MDGYERITNLPCQPRPGAPEYIVERRNAPMALWSFRFTVTGKGSFPLDMLRRDQCYPTDGESAAAIGDGDRSSRSVRLQSDQPRVHWLPTFERWRSFGWIVKTDVEERA